MWATLLDEGTYLCSIRTMYRILEEHGEVRERRNQRRHPNYTKPELLAEAPNQVWSWDITKLRGPVKWTYYYLYVILDIFSRYVVGWMLAHRESAALAQRLIAESCRKQDIEPDQLTLHADRGSSMRSKPVALLLADLGVTKTHSRPYVSNDNPYSESQFKTMKYCPQFPSRFGSAEDGRLFCGGFFDYYNYEHRHSGIGFMTPADVHYGRAEQLTTARRQILLEAHRTHPERFVRGTPQPPVLPPQAWINPPTEKTTLLNAAQATSRGGVHTWGTPFFCSTKRYLDRCRCGPHRRHEPPDANRASLNAARECLKVVDTYRGKKGKLQINYGLLTNERGIPVSVSVFEGNTGDPKTLLPQVEKVQERFGIEQFVMVGDRGMITQTQIDELREMDGVDWITALRPEPIRKLINDGVLQMELFDERNLFEVTHPDFPNERLVACRNPELAERRRHKRRALLEATCKELEKVCRMVERRRLQGKEDIRAAVKKLLNKYKVGRYYRLDIRDDGFDFELDETTMDADASRLANGNSELANKRLQRWKRHMGTIAKQFGGIRQRIGRGQLHGKDKIGVRVGRVLNKYKVGKHFKLDIRDDSFSFEIDDTKVTAEAALDGIYVIRTSLAEQRMKTDDTVRSYKLLTQVERAFRSFKSMDLKVRPIRHRRENRVRAHVFLCMLAYYVLWHMMEAWRPLLFSDEDQQAKASVTRLLRRSAPRPPCARYKPRSLTMGVELPASARCCAFSATSSETNVGDRKPDPTSPPSMSRQLRTRNSREPTTCSKVSPCRQKPAPLIPTISLDQHRILAFSARNFSLVDLRAAMGSSPRYSMYRESESKRLPESRAIREPKPSDDVNSLQWDRAADACQLSGKPGLVSRRISRTERQSSSDRWAKFSSWLSPVRTSYSLR